MFNIFKSGKNKTKAESDNGGTLSAVADGELIPITDVPDQVFSQKILGDGYAILPSSGSIVSPVSGTVTEVYDTGHAYCITSGDGLEILVHIGIDTVELKGNGFSAIVGKGDKVLRNSPIAVANIELIKSLGYKTFTMVVITNPLTVKSLTLTKEKHIRAGDTALTYKL